MDTVKPFKDMTYEEQGDHLLHVHGLADAEEIMFDSHVLPFDVAVAIEAHTYSHGVFETAQEHEHEDQEAIDLDYAEMTRGQ